MYCEQSSEEREVRAMAGRIYAERRTYLLRIARRNAPTAADAEEALQDTFANFIVQFDPHGEAPALGWLTTALKRRCWRARETGRLDRRVFSLPDSRHEEPSGLIERRPEHSEPLPDRQAERAEARARLAALKPDERTAIGLHAAGLDYAEIGERCGWTHTKVNRCLYEGRLALRGGQGAGGLAAPEKMPA
jgi:RNA polymerase sigma factor (sigma-70 family)